MRDGAFEVMQVEFVTNKKVDVESFEIENTGKDLARLHVSSKDLEEGKDYVILPRLSKDEELKEQDEVVAIGFAKGLKWTFTGGMVSALSCPSADLLGNLADAFPANFKCVQFDASLNPGNSGGPLFRKKDDAYVWIGINTFKLKGENLNFAIHVEEFFDKSYKTFPMSEKGVKDAIRMMNSL